MELATIYHYYNIVWKSNNNKEIVELSIALQWWSLNYTLNYVPINWHSYSIDLWLRFNIIESRRPVPPELLIVNFRKVRSRYSVNIPKTSLLEQIFVSVLICINYTTEYVNYFVRIYSYVCPFKGFFFVRLRYTALHNMYPMCKLQTYTAYNVE